MSEPFEVQVIVKCPECGETYTDWIVFDPDLPLMIEELCGDCEEVKR